MAIEVSVLRVFTDSDGNFGNPLGVINASKVEHRDRQQLAAQSGYSETIFVDLPSPGSTTAHATIPYSPHRNSVRRTPDRGSVLVAAREGDAN